MSRVLPALALIGVLSACPRALAQQADVLGDVAAPSPPLDVEPVDLVEPLHRAEDFDQDPREFESDVQLEIGRALASEGRCELAVPRLERSLELADSLDARFHLGACLHALGRHAESIEHIERFASQVDPDVDIERAAIALRILERARDEVGSIALVVEPPGALVIVDGRAVVGTGQRLVRVDAGRHVIRAEYVGHETLVRTVDVEPGTRVLRLLQLQRRAEPGAWLEVDTDPPHATVTVDGRLLRPGYAVQLSPGWHRVSAAAPGHDSRQREVDIAAGERLRLDLSLPERRDDAPLIIGGTAAVVGAVILGVVIGVAIASSDNGAAGSGVPFELAP